MLRRSRVGRVRSSGASATSRRYAPIDRESLGAPELSSAGTVTLRPDEIEALAAAYGTTRSFRKHTVIVSEGDGTESFFVVLSGRVKIFLSDEQGKEITLATHGKGEFFGETVVEPGRGCASVMTLESSRLVVVPGAALVEFLLARPDVMFKITQKLVRRVRALTATVGALALTDVYGRVARLMVELCAMNGGSPVVPRLSQQEMANRVAASREMISRVLRKLCEEGYIELQKKHIRILRQPQLPG